MCVVSMVHDHYDPLIPQPGGTGTNGTSWWTPPIGDSVTIYPLQSTYDIATLVKLIEDYYEAKKAAEIVDKLTGQPDCIDPKKAELEKRVQALEEEIALLKQVEALEAEAAELRKKVGQ